MIYDYFAALALEKFEPNNLNANIYWYLYLEAAIQTENDKKERDVLKKKAENVKKKWLEREANTIIADDYLAVIKEPKIDLSYLPRYSFIIQFKFYLKTPFLSRGNQDFYMIDNPVLTDKTFRVPYIAPSIWKGCLRSALWNLGYQEDTPEIRLLFGNERREEHHEALQEGRLHFFPSFFQQKTFEVINPHDRMRKVGKNPILMECIKQDSEGLFTLLYTPFGWTAERVDTIQKQTIECLNLIVKGLRAMFLDYGFGAKTSSGFGIAKPEIRGKFQIKANIDPIDIKSFYNLCELSEKVSMELNSGGDEDGCRS